MIENQENRNTMEELLTLIQTQLSECNFYNLFYLFH
jgi:hypothetical protein